MNADGPGSQDENDGAISLILGISSTFGFALANYLAHFHIRGGLYKLLTWAVLVAPIYGLWVGSKALRTNKGNGKGFAVSGIIFNAIPLIGWAGLVILAYSE